MLATSTTLYLRALYVLTMLSFLHNYCCRGPINRQGDCKFKWNYIISLLHLSRLKCVRIAWVPKHMLEVAFQKLVQEGSQHLSRFVSRCWPHSCVTCSSQMGMRVVIQCMYVMHMYVCGVNGESHILPEVGSWPCVDRFLATMWMLPTMSIIISPIDMPPSSLTQIQQWFNCNFGQNAFLPQQ